MILFNSKSVVTETKSLEGGGGELTFVVLLKLRFHLLGKQRSGLIGHQER
jgi:hypothetical protein